LNLHIKGKVIKRKEGEKKVKRKSEKERNFG
jgi:hypothetical protein